MAEFNMVSRTYRSLRSTTSAACADQHTEYDTRSDARAADRLPRQSHATAVALNSAACCVLSCQLLVRRCALPTSRQLAAAVRAVSVGVPGQRNVEVLPLLRACSKAVTASSTCGDKQC